MTNTEAAEEIQKAIDLIRQDGKDWLDERDIPILEMAINALEKEAWKEEHPVSPLLQKLATNLQPSKQLSNDSPELDKENGELIRRKEAINTVHRMREIWDTGDIDDLEEMIVTALAELCPEKRTETHACDCIERQAAIDALHRYFDGMLETDTWSPCDVYGLIEILTSAQPELPEWAQKVEEYRKSAPSFVRNQLVWALYQTWKEYDGRLVHQRGKENRWLNI